MDSTSIHRGKRIAFPPIWLGFPWPVDPNAPDAPTEMWVRPNWETGEFEEFDKYPRQSKRIFKNHWYCPIDPNAPKGKKPVFNPNPADEIYGYTTRDGEIVKLSDEEIQAYRQAIQHPEPSTPDDNPIVLSNPLDDPESGWAKAFAKYSDDKLFPKPDRPGDIPVDGIIGKAFEPLPDNWRERAERIFNLIEEKIDNDEMKPKSKKERIAALELKMEMLRDQLQDYITACGKMQDRLEEFVAGRLTPVMSMTIEEFSGDVRPKEGIAVYATYDGNKCVAWIGHGTWWIQHPNHSAQIDIDIKKLKWFQLIATNK
jgi:hypothetical protein